MIRQAAFEQKHEFLKGALHVHTSRSDGDDKPGFQFLQSYNTEAKKDLKTF